MIAHPLASLLEAFAEIPRDPRTSPLTGAVLVSHLLHPDRDLAFLRADVDEAVTALLTEVTDTPWEALHRLGFQGNRNTYDLLENSCIDAVLRSRKGIPITLGVVLISVATRLGLRAGGINHPGHFLVDVGGVVIDPFVMQKINTDGALQTMERVHDAPHADTATIVLRMLNNIKHVSIGSADWNTALNAMDAQLALLNTLAGPEDRARIRLEQGDVWQRLGSTDMARRAYKAGIELAEADALRGVLVQRLDDLGGKPDLIH